MKSLLAVSKLPGVYCEETQIMNCYLYMISNYANVTYNHKYYVVNAWAIISGFWFHSNLSLSLKSVFVTQLWRKSSETESAERNYHNQPLFFYIIVLKVFVCNWSPFFRKEDELVSLFAKPSFQHKVAVPFLRHHRIAVNGGLISIYIFHTQNVQEIKFYKLSTFFRVADIAFWGEMIICRIFAFDAFRPTLNRRHFADIFIYIFLN